MRREPSTACTQRDGVRERGREREYESRLFPLLFPYIVCDSLSLWVSTKRAPNCELSSTLVYADDSCVCVCVWEFFRSRSLSRINRYIFFQLYYNYTFSLFYQTTVHSGVRRSCVLCVCVLRRRACVVYVNCAHIPFFMVHEQANHDSTDTDSILCLLKEQVREKGKTFLRLLLVVLRLGVWRAAHCTNSILSQYRIRCVCVFILYYTLTLFMSMCESECVNKKSLNRLLLESRISSVYVDESVC